MHTLTITAHGREYSTRAAAVARLEELARADGLNGSSDGRETERAAILAALGTIVTPAPAPAYAPREIRSDYFLTATDTGEFLATVNAPSAELAIVFYAFSLHIGMGNITATEDYLS